MTYVTSFEPKHILRESTLKGWEFNDYFTKNPAKTEQHNKMYLWIYKRREYHSYEKGGREGEAVNKTQVCKNELHQSKDKAKH